VKVKLQELTIITQLVEAARHHEYVTLLDDAPDLLVHWVNVGAVLGPPVRRNEAGSVRRLARH